MDVEGVSPHSGQSALARSRLLKIELELKRHEFPSCQRGVLTWGLPT